MVTSSQDWLLEEVETEFRLLLDPAAKVTERERVDGEAIASIQERMKLCPVSRNLPDAANKRITVTVATAAP